PILRAFHFFFIFLATPVVYPLSYTTLFRSQFRDLLVRDRQVVPLLHLRRRREDRLEQLLALLELRRQRDARDLAAALESQELFRSEEHTSELQSRGHLVCLLLLEKINRNTL